MDNYLDVLVKHLKGACAQCRRERSLPFCRDCYLICAECEWEIKLSLKLGQTTECTRCRQTFSRLWCEFTEKHDYRCHECASPSCCAFCGEFGKLPYACGNEVEGWYLFCEKCHERSESVAAAELEVVNNYAH